MMYKVCDNLSFGDKTCCSYAQSGQAAIVHACKEPCHRKILRYKKRSLPESHPGYLVVERGPHLYMNLVDPEVPLFRLESFIRFLDFVDKHIGDREVIIHCNQGRSRSPSLALLYMAKRGGKLSDESYEKAAKEFGAKFPYTPSRGIEIWLKENWDSIK